MTRIRFWCFAVTLTAVVVAIAFIYKATGFVGAVNVHAERVDLRKALDVKSQVAQYHLYSGAVSDVSGIPLVPLERKVDLFENGSLLPSAAYDKNKDLSSGNSLFYSDGVTAESFSYYPDLSNDGIRRLHVKSEFFPDGKLQDEDVRHKDGTPEKRTNILATGEKHVVDYAADGVSILDDALYVPDSCCRDLIVKSEKRFRDNREHQLLYSDVLNADGTRSVVEFDEHLNQVRTEQWPANGTVPGTVIIVLYPDTLHTRFVSRSDSTWDTIDYFRNDGTLERRAKLSAASTRVMVFDSTGQKPLFEQSWGMVMTGVSGVMVSRWYLSDLTEFDGQGNKVRTLSYTTNGALLFEMKYDVTVGGVKYERAVSFYDAANFLKTSKYFLQATEDMTWFNSKPGHEDFYTPADNIRVVLPPSTELRPLERDSQLPVPPPQWHEH